MPTAVAPVIPVKPQTLQEDAKERTKPEQRTTSDVEEQISTFLRAITNETPIAYTFVNWNIREKTSGGFVGALGGAVLGGLVGSVFGEALFKKSSFFGELGILVVTETQLLLVHFTAPFSSTAGDISPEHLDALQAQIQARSVSQKQSDIHQTQLSTSTSTPGRAVLKLVSLSDSIELRASNLFVDGTQYNLPDLEEIQSCVSRQDPLITPEAFIDKLLRNANPMSENRFQHVKSKEKYAIALFNAITTNKNRDVVVQNLSCLAPSVKAMLTSQIRTKGNASSILRYLGILALLTVVAAGLVGVVIATKDAHIEFLTFAIVALVFLVVALLTLFMIVGVFLELRCSLWCKSILKKNHILND